MTAPRSVWVLVWPDGSTAATYLTYPTYDAAHAARVRCEAHNARVVRYDIHPASPQVASTLPPPVASEADVVPGLQHGPSAVPAVEAGDHEQPFTWYRDPLAPDAAVCQPWIGCGGADITLSGDRR